MSPSTVPELILKLQFGLGFWLANSGLFFLDWVAADWYGGYSGCWHEGCAAAVKVEIVELDSDTANPIIGAVIDADLVGAALEFYLEVGIGRGAIEL